jgi:predicted NAD/FAD-binding protein
MNNPMTPAQALQILSDATEPATQGKISRQGYIAIQTALEVIAKLIPQEEAPTPSE